MSSVGNMPLGEEGIIISTAIRPSEHNALPVIHTRHFLQILAIPVVEIVQILVYAGLPTSVLFEWLAPVVHLAHSIALSLA